MDEETDSQLKSRWERLEQGHADLKAKKFPPNLSRQQFKEQLDAEKQTIEMLWGSLLERKKSGKLTDLTYIDPLKKIIKEASDWRQLQIKFELKETDIDRTTRPDGSFGFSKYWFLEVTYDGARANLRMLRWNGMVEAATKEISSINLAHVIPEDEQFWRVYDHEVPKGYFDRDYRRTGAPMTCTLDSEKVAAEEDAMTPEEHEAYMLRDPYCRPAAKWLVDTFVWDGPPEKKSGGRKSALAELKRLRSNF